MTLEPGDSAPDFSTDVVSSNATNDSKWFDALAWVVIWLLSVAAGTSSDTIVGSQATPTAEKRLTAEKALVSSESHFKSSEQRTP